MEIKFNKISFSLKLATDKKYPDLLAYVSIKLIDEHERYVSFNGFTLRKSKYEGNPYFLGMPSKKSGNSFFKFALMSESLRKEIEKEIIRQYQMESIPVIEESPAPYSNEEISVPIEEI